MNQEKKPTDIYTSRVAECQEQLSLLKITKDRIAWARLVNILLIIAAAYYLYPVGFIYAAIAVMALSALFTRLIILAVNNKSAIENVGRLIGINQQELDIAAGHYTNLPSGLVPAPAIHDYANDLDIFGRASLFQYINRTQSEPAQDKLVNWLLHPSDAVTIHSRQQSAKEMAGYYQWRQQLQAHGMATAIQRTTEQKLAAWAAKKNTFITKPYWQVLRFLLPAIILTVSFLYLNDNIPAGYLAAAILLFIGLSSLISRQITPVYKQLNKIINEINTLYNSIECIEQQSFQSTILKTNQAVFINGQSKASTEVKKLKLILDRLDFRLNPMVFVPVNTFFFWDLQQIIALEKWKEKNKAYIPQWIGAMAEMEALSTVANLHFNHPGWVFPVLHEENHGTFQSTQLGHPLIPESKMVYNNFSTNGTAQLALITGSNMAGKSTFLRSVGVNMVLAMMGAPVCARQMRLSPMRIVSSMRIADNLEESTSTFYAELKKLKSIIEYVNNNEKVFVLLDEILRGTNSLDRHTGSKALVKQLIKKNAVAMLATHDVELAQLQIDFPANIHNYHFDAQIENEELYFDYKLKEGICQSINASILMKKIGIEL
jgi:MutS domain V